jgi:hypothetical protein
MLNLILASVLTCSASQELVENLRNNINEEMTSDYKSEVMEVIMDYTEEGCWDAND